MNPELPPLKWDGYCWEGEVVLPSWRGFQTRRGPYAAISSDEPSDGSARVRFDTGGAGQVPPTEAQVAAFRWLAENDAVVTAAILDAVFAQYPRFREEFIDAVEDEDAQAAAQEAPPLDRPEQLRMVTGLAWVIFLPVEKGGVGYAGFEFGCVWEEEHGLGVMTHKDRVIDVGGAYSAFVPHRAVEDAAEPR